MTRVRTIRDIVCVRPVNVHVYMCSEMYLTDPPQAYRMKDAFRWFETDKNIWKIKIGFNVELLCNYNEREA